MFVASLAKLRQLCLALPETTEVGVGDDPTFGVKGQTFATCHRVGDRESVWFKASPRTRSRLLSNGDDRRFFTPPYVGQHGWIGAWIDENCDWSQLDALLRESYQMTAPDAQGDNASRRENATTLIARAS
ncbi:hypothetical protein Snas_0837 [Stackebrandtia nassauensis DSM 44728]|uniref:Phosphoribosylglycinamide formyltransferase n=1 Tax=Stackebrandtia nassauensis (strain DSM 44728 / CIP 108903 / NRRL B-16338 / NBRC 102104 / LLR-40K-21) TaxID=446470 RepID=D3Q844_STANL|nr:hypothetical protein Snas_0837 [Stackebrandtia nassauensis DSM 44728]